MIGPIPIGMYLAGRSFVHRLDPRTKILSALVLMAALFVVRGFLGFAVLAAFVLLSVAAARLPVGMILRGLRPVLFLLALTLVLNALLTPGRPVLVLGPVRASAEGLRLGAFLAIRLALLVTMTTVLTLTTSPVALTEGLERLLGPFRRLGVPAHELAMMMTIALRFVPTLAEETQKIMKAQEARGADFRTGGLVRRARSLIPVLVPLFVSAFRRAEELALAMEARGYRGGAGRTRLRELKAGGRDAVAAALTAGALVVTWWLRGAAGAGP